MEDWELEDKSQWKTVSASACQKNGLLKAPAERVFTNKDRVYWAWKENVKIF